MRLIKALLCAVTVLCTLLVAPAAHATTPLWEVQSYAYVGDGNPDHQLTATWATVRHDAPWVLTIHGGSWVNGSQANTQNAVDLFSSHGWQAFNVSYRMGTGITWQDQVADIDAARDWIIAHAAQFGIDPRRGTVYGFSSGGHLAAVVSTQGVFADLVSLSGVLQPQRVAQDALGMRPTTEPDTSAITYLYGREVAIVDCAFQMGVPLPSTAPCMADWTAFCPEYDWTSTPMPSYLVQGEDDQIVPPSTAGAFGYHVRAHGGVADVVMVPGYGHDDREVYGSSTREEAMLQWVVAHS